MTESKRTVGASKTSCASHENRNRKRIAPIRLSGRTVSINRTGFSARSGSGSWPPGFGSRSDTRAVHLPALRVLRHQFIEFREELRIVLPRIERQLLLVCIQVKEEGFNSFLVQLSPKRSIASLVEIEGVKDLLELMLHRNAEIRLPEMQGFAHERKSGVRDYRFRASEIF